MLFGEIISVALGALRANKLRSLLTMLGIVIGVAAVIAMIALGNGAQKAVKDRISALGTTLLTVQPGQAFGMGGIRSGEAQRMTMDDAKAIEERADHIVAVQPEMQRQLQIQYNNRNANTSDRRHDRELPRGPQIQAAAGKMFTPGARRLTRTRGGDRSCRRHAARLRQPDSARRASRSAFAGFSSMSIGVLKSKGQGGGFGNPDDQVLIPINTARFRAIGSDRLRSINVLAEERGRDSSRHGRDSEGAAARASPASRARGRLQHPEPVGLPEHAWRDDRRCSGFSSPVSRR